MLSRPFASLAVVLAVLSLPALVGSEAFGQKGDRVKLKGKVKTVSEKQMAIEEKPETDYLIHISSRTHVSVEGTAVPDYLTHGVDVEVVADVNKAGVIPTPLSEITVCTFNEGHPATFAPEDPTKASHKGKDAVNRYVIRGTIKTIRGGKLTMLALLPPAGAANCPVPATAALRTIAARLATAGPKGSAAGPKGSGPTSIALPKVNLSSQVSMKGVLSKLGMGVAFSQSADFAGLSSQACCIGLVEHAATLRVGEKGTVGSAATAVGMTPSSAEVPSPEIAFNRPYLLLVTDTVTGEPLFLARVTNPAAR